MLRAIREKSLLLEAWNLLRGLLMCCFNVRLYSKIIPSYLLWFGQDKSVLLCGIFYLYLISCFMREKSMDSALSTLLATLHFANQAERCLRCIVTAEIT